MGRKQRKSGLQAAYDWGYNLGGSSRRRRSRSAASVPGCFVLGGFLFYMGYLLIKDLSKDPRIVTLFIVVISLILVGIVAYIGLVIRGQKLEKEEALRAIELENQRIIRVNELERQKIELLLRYRQLVDVDPGQFELFVANLFEKQGFTVKHTGTTGDGGVDLEMDKDGLSFVVQCKKYTKDAIGEPALRDFYGTIASQKAHHGYFVTTSRFTQPAIDFARNKPITLIDEVKLQQWLESDTLPDSEHMASTSQMISEEYAQKSIAASSSLPLPFAVNSNAHIPTIHSSSDNRRKPYFGMTKGQIAILFFLGFITFLMLILAALIFSAL